MKQLDRYILRELFGPFIFFLLVFAGILWLNQALKVIDLVVDNGQSGTVFLEISAYLLPKTMESVISLSGFAAAVFLTNRLFTESEMVVMMNSGRGPFLIAKSYMIFGVFCFVLVSALTHYITPKAVEAFNNRSYEIRKSFVVKIVQPGSFVNPTKGVTLFFGESYLDGSLRDILIQESTAEGLATYLAPSGQLLNSEDDPKLLLLDGSIQQFNRKTDNLTIGQFDTLSYDLSQFGANIPKRVVTVLERTTLNLIGTLENPKLNENKRNEHFLQIHRRILDALIALAAPLVGVSVLMVGQFQRTGFVLRIVLSVIVVIGAFSLQGAAISGLGNAPHLWPLAYLPSVLTFAACTGFLIRGSQSRKPSKRTLRALAEAST